MKTPLILCSAACFFMTVFAVSAQTMKDDASVVKPTTDLKFSLSDKASDGDQAIKEIYTVFETNDDDKDRQDGISEQYKVGNEVIVQNTSWGKDLIFREHSTNVGQTFNIAGRSITAKNVNTIVYHWRMDNNDGWNVNMVVYIRLANDHLYIVGSHYWNIHSGANQGDIGLAW